MQRRLQRISRSKKNNFFLLLPISVLILTLSLYPILRGIYLGFTNYRIGRSAIFTGFDNYIYLSGSGYFWSSLGRQAFITFGSMVMTYIIGITLALILNSDIPFKRFFRILAIVPWAVPPIVKVAIWENMFSTNTGWINHLLMSFGMIDKYIGWVGDKNKAIYCVMVMITWGCVPYLALTILSALQNISKDYYEAASIDGATSFQQFLNITIPMLKPVLVVTSSFLFIWIANDFTSQYLLTNGGPGSATLTLSVEAYRQGFERGYYGIACAYGNLTMAFMGAFLVLYLRAIRNKGDAQV